MAASKTQLITAAIVGAICVTGAVVGGVKAVNTSPPPSQPTPGAVRAMARVAPVGPTLTGIIRDPAGKPLAGAEILICSQGQSLNIYANGTAPTNRITIAAKTCASCPTCRHRCHRRHCAAPSPSPAAAFESPAPPTHPK